MKTDDWGFDPQIQYIRRLFAGKEKAQKDLFKTLGLSPYDHRLGPWRQAALNLFEKVWTLSIRRNLSLEEKDIVEVYLYCLVTILRSQEVTIPAGLVPEKEMIRHLLEEVQR